ncbi:unnamed protein product, partial [Phaeothamnion confervicola]
EDADGVCCDAAADNAVAALFAATAGINGATDECKDLHKQILCIPCHAWSSHLTADNWNTLGVNGGMLSSAFCEEYVTACGSSLGVTDDFCAVHSRTPDSYYHYPFAKPADFAAGVGILPVAFPNLPDGEIRPAMTDMQMRPDGKAWYIVSQLGEVYEMSSNVEEATKWTLVVSFIDEVKFAGEMGTLGLAFSPAFATTGHFYVNYNHERGGDQLDCTRISRFTKSNAEDPAVAAAETRSSEVIVMEFDQLHQNHNGGWVSFKPSAYKDDGPDQTSHVLYIGTGDGGAGNDPVNSAQTMTTVLGKILRIRVRTDEVLNDPKYDIPDDNPLVGSGNGVREEIYAWGLRNPWRCSFDMVTEDLWCGDVGQQRIEEVNLIVAGGNYGWGQWEGERC